MKKIFLFFAAISMLFAASQKVMAYDVDCHFYIPAAHGFATASGCALQWHLDGEETSKITPLTAEPEASSWFMATLSWDDIDKAAHVTLLNASTAEAATKTLVIDQPIEYYGAPHYLVGKNADGSFQLYAASSYYSTYPEDYLPYNLQAHQGQDTLYVSWESNSVSYSAYVSVFDANDLSDEIANTFVYDNQQSGYVLLNNAETMQIVWRVRPNVSYDVQQAFNVYSAPMTVLPSPKVATNVKATLNADGTYTFSWDAAKSSEVKQYWVEVRDPKNTSVYYCEDYVRTTSVTGTIKAMYSGEYTIHVKSYGESTWSTLGEAVGKFNVAPVAEHPLTTRILLGSQSGIDTSAGVKFSVEKTANNTEIVDAVSEPYGWWSYTFNTTERGARIGLKDQYTMDIYGDTCVEYYGYNYKSVECDARADEYVPHDIVLTPNGDGTYTISWLMDATARASYYDVRMTHSTTGQSVLSLNECRSAQAKTGVLEAGNYYVSITVYEEIPNKWGGMDHDRIAGASTYFVVEEQPAHDITIRVLPQPGSGEWGAFLYNTEEFEYSTQIIFNKETDSPWYTWTYNTTSPALNVMFKDSKSLWYSYGGSLIPCSGTTCIEYEDGFKIVDCGTALKDYTISNVQREDLGDSKMKFTWECATNPAQFKIYINDANDTPIKVFEADGADRSFTDQILVDSTMATVKWYILPVLRNDNYLWDLKADGTPFSLTASPYVPQNIVASPNANGTWTVSWDACPAPVTSYSVYNSADGYTNWVSETTFTTSTIPEVGTFTVTVTAQLSNGETGGTKSAKFNVLPVPARDITIRLLIHLDAKSTYAQQLYRPDTYEYIDAVEDGSGWYHYTINSTNPAQKIQLYGSQYTVAKDTCFEYVEYLNYGACDAVQHDYRLIESSVHAESLPGKAVFTWSAVEKSEQYQIYLQYYDDESGYWQYITSELVKDTFFTYMVPDEKDGKELKWYVYPSAPHNLYTRRIDGNNITLHKSAVELTDLKVSTTDSVHYHFSWASNASDIRYEFQLSHSFYGNMLCSVVQAGKTYDYTFISGESPYRWRVRAVDAEGKPLTVWVEYKENVYAKSSLHALSNLQGTITGHKLNYTWSKTTAYVSASLECQVTDKGYMSIFTDSILSGNSLSVDAQYDGRYTLRLTPVVEIAPKKYFYISEELQSYLNHFTEKTYHIAVSTTTGGFLADELTGDYPAGYTLFLRIWEAEGYRFVGWSDGNTERRRVYTVEGDANLIALFEAIPERDVTIVATTGGKISVDYSSKEVSRIDTTLYDGNYLYIQAKVEDGYVFYGWSDGYSSAQLSRSIYVTQDTAITATFKPICYLSVSAGVGGRVQVTGGQYDKANKRYSCVYGTDITIKANPDDGYRFSQWSDGDKNVTRTINIKSNVTLSATFVSVETPLKKYTVRVLTADEELGSVSQVSGTYTEGDKVTITATPAEKAYFTGWSDGVAQASRVITVSQDTTLTASFAIKQFTLTVSASAGGSVNTEVNGTYAYGTQVDLKAVAKEGYHFTGWSDGYPYDYRTVEMTEDITLTANFAQQTYLVTFLNADGSLIEANPYAYGEMPVCSVTPELAPTTEWIYTFTGWDPAIKAVTGNAVYTAVYSKEPNPGSGFDNIEVREQATKVLINGQIFILRGDRIYTIQGQVVR